MNFDINNAMNTFNQQLGARVASGQMTMDQARAAQAEMTALQRMPNATREQATDVAQRQMQVGQYAPTPQGGLTLANVPQRLTLGNTPMPQADTGFNINNAMNTFNQSLGERVASGQMTMDQARTAQAEMTALQRTANPTREQATNVAQSQLQVGQYAPVARPDIVVQPQRIMPAPLPSTPPAPMPKMVQPTEMQPIEMQPIATQPTLGAGGSGSFNESTGAFTNLPRGLVNLLQRGPMAPSQPMARPMAQPVARPYVFDAGIGDGTMARPQPMAQRPTGMLFNNLMNKYRGRAY
jgi:polyhydroxyalkanoate synthesis regulator phasin